MVRTSTACLLAGLLLAPAAVADDDGVPPPAPAPVVMRHHVDLLYNGYFLGRRVMKASVVGEVAGDGSYYTTAVFRTAGLAALFKDAEITATVNGAFADGYVQPVHFQHHNSASSKNRQIAIDFSSEDVVSTVTPPFGSMGVPPATREQRLGSRDLASTILAIVLEGGDAPCERTLPVFDGKQRYDLRFEPVAYEDIDVRGFEGPGWRCDVYYNPIAGYDPEDLADPEEYARPVQMWLADLGDERWAPVRVRARISGVRVTIEAKRVVVESEAAPQAAATDAGPLDHG